MLHRQLDSAEGLETPRSTVKVDIPLGSLNDAEPPGIVEIWNRDEVFAGTRGSQLSRSTLNGT